MVTISEDCPRRKANVAGGDGLVESKVLAVKEQMYGHVRLFNHVILQPGNSIGDHTHTGETEFYYILKGNPKFNDNGNMKTLRPGDITSTSDGEIHGIYNETDSVVEFIALIPMDQ